VRTVATAEWRRQFVPLRGSYGMNADGGDWAYILYMLAPRKAWWAKHG
jgi:hypothetical protein